MLSEFLGNTNGISKQQGVHYALDDMASGIAQNKSIGMEASLSLRNVPSTPGYDGNAEEYSSGKTAENYEITQYNAAIETGDLEDTCAKIFALKALDYVIFENSNEYDNRCYFYFKVETAKRGEILDIIKAMNPKDLSENIQSIKNQIDDFTSEEDILKKKKETIESTLNDAINSYDEIARVATAARDAESLAKIIDSKIRIIEKLSTERISINEQLDRLGRAKAEQLDRLEYAYFQITVSENKYIDGETLKDSWKAAVKSSVYDINRIFQEISVKLAVLLFTIIQYAIYILIIAFAAKYGWKIIKNIWNK